jgi:hypothetical protein
MSDQGIFPLREHKRESGVFLLLLPFVSAMIYIHMCVYRHHSKPPSLLKRKGEKGLCKNLLLRDGAYLKGKRGARGTGADEVRR